LASGNVTYSRLVQPLRSAPFFIGTAPAPARVGLGTRTQMVVGIPGSPTPHVLIGGSGDDSAQAAAVDPSGHIWIVGSTDSDDFLLVNPIEQTKVSYRTAGFVIELDSSLSKVLFATYLCGQLPKPAPGSPDLYSTGATAITLDQEGNAYIAGTTDETDLPVTPGAYRISGGGTREYDTGDMIYTSYLVKISSAGKLVYATYLLDGGLSCTGGGACIGRSTTDSDERNLVVDATGAVTVAGTHSCCGYIQGSAGHVVRVAADGSKLLWTATSIGSTYGPLRSLWMAQEPSGEIDLFGQYTHVNFVTTGIANLGSPGLFVSKLKSDGSA
jgi:hypothetical protein